MYDMEKEKRKAIDAGNLSFVSIERKQEINCAIYRYVLSYGLKRLKIKRE